MINENNPGFLKLDLFCKGMKIGENCELGKDARPVLRTRGGLGSGLEIILPENLHVNVPVYEQFAQNSPYMLDKINGRYVLLKAGKEIVNVVLPPCPGFYNKNTSSGLKMREVGVMQGTYLGIYPTEICFFWETTPRINCRFCSVGLNLGKSEALEKSVDDVVETIIEAWKELDITYVHFNTGYYGEKVLDILKPYIEAVKKETGLLIGVQCPPVKDHKKYNELKRIGVNQVSFCFELFNPDKFREFCPGKNEYIGQERFFDTIKYCIGLFPAVNGELIAGLEPVEDTIKAIDWLTSVGALPTVCVFRPCVGTDLENVPPPQTEDMIPVFSALYEKCVRSGRLMEMAPNIKVSIVILPEEGRYFIEKKDLVFRLFETKNTVLSNISRRWFKKKIKNFNRKMGRVRQRSH